MFKNTPFYIKTTLIFFLMISNILSTEVTLNPDANSVFTVPNNSNNLKISFTVGKEFTIKIKGNPTTGYGWFLDNANELDRNVLKPLNLNEHNSADYITDPHIEGMVGVGGYYYFKFEGQKKTDGVNLRFVNKRPWETTVDRTVNVSVTLN